MGFFLHLGHKDFVNKGCGASIGASCAIFGQKISHDVAQKNC